MSSSKDSTPDPATRTPIRRRRTTRVAALGTAAVAVLAGGTFWLSGGYEAWQSDRALDSACDGDLAADAARGLLGGIELTATGGLGQDGWSCAVTAADEARDGAAEVTVRIRSADEPFDAAGPVDPGGAAVPLGEGWTGSFTYGGGGTGEVDATRTDRARVVLLLDCGEEPGDGLLAWADGRLEKGDFRDADARARLAGTLTETTLSYARRTGCAPKPGDDLAKVAAPVADRKPKPLGEASGTCGGVLDAATAREWGAGTALETPVSGPMAVERCTLGSRLGAPLYAFTASYGPYGASELTAPPEDVRPAEDGAESPSGRYRMTAECPGGGGTAVYDVVPGEDLGRTVDHGSLKAALKRFAESSAGRHGCRGVR